MLFFVSYSLTNWEDLCSGSSTTGKPVGAYCDVLAQCEVTRVLLLMLLQVMCSWCSVYLLYLVFVCI